MAYTPLPADSIRDNSAIGPDALRRLADIGAKLGSLIRQVSYLTIAINDAADDIPTPDEESRTALDRALVFLDLVEQTAAEALALAEEVEASSNRLLMAKGA